MIVIDYKKEHHKKIIHACVLALKKGKVVAYPTDTSYGLAVDALNLNALKNLYKVKGRNFNKPVSIIPPSAVFSKKIAEWNSTSSKLAKKFWPGPLTLVLQSTQKSHVFKRLTANTGLIALRLPKNIIALDLAGHLNSPITATSANVSGKSDCYSADEILLQYKNSKIQPDIIINAGKLPKQKPSTLVQIIESEFKIIRTGPISKQKIERALK